MSKANFPWSSSRRIQDEPILEDNNNNNNNNPKNGIIIDHPKLEDNNNNNNNTSSMRSLASRRRKKLQQIAVSRIRSIFSSLQLSSNNNKKSSSSSNMGHHLGKCPRIVGTLFGYRKGHVHFVFQRDHNTTPVFFIELATPITNLVNEMAYGLVRIALECDKHDDEDNNNNNDKRVKMRRKRLLEEQVWRTFCNGKNCGFGIKREIGPNEAKILKAVEPISMGAGVLPGFNGSGSGTEGELMYMRAQFERVVGSRDSEAFYMVNPDSHGTPELSIYLLRV